MKKPSGLTGRPINIIKQKRLLVKFAGGQLLLVHSL